MSEGSMPTMRVELSGLKMGMVGAFIDKLDEVKEFTKKTIEASFDSLMEGGLEKVIIREVRQALEGALSESLREAVSEEVYHYFNKGAGKDRLVEAVLAGLSKPEEKG